MKTTNLILTAICILASGCMPNYSEGERDGVVVKLSRKGMIWKSWEGEAVIGGMKSKTIPHYGSDGKYAGSSTSSVVNVFEFNVGEEMVPKVKEAMASGQPVRLIYREWWMSPPTIDNDHVVIGVRPLE